MIRWMNAPGPYDVVFSTREGGVSEGPFSSLNLGRKTADKPERVDENRRRLCAEVAAHPEALALNYQHHSADVLRARPGARGDRADGLWTDEPGLPVLALTADCLPIALARANGSEPALAVLHAGWRGLVAGITQAGVEALHDGPIAAIIGPGIGPCCYEVGPEVSAQFDDDLTGGGRLDLWTAAERSLRAAGCVSVERMNLCTACNPERFFSHRRDRGVTGRQGVIGRIR